MIAHLVFEVLVDLHGIILRLQYTVQAPEHRKWQYHITVLMLLKESTQLIISHTPYERKNILVVGHFGLGFTSYKFKLFLFRI
jgi:hypothetical protein